MELAIQKICSQSSNRWLILIHGFLGSAEDWNEIIFLLPEDWNYFLIDLPGHGRSKKLNSRRFYSMNWIATWLYEQIIQLKPAKVGVLGYSMGGRVALHLAELMEQELDFLILESVSPGIEDLSEREKRMAWDESQAQVLRKKGLEEFLKQWYDMPLFASLRSHPEFSKLLQRRRQNSAFGLSMAMKYMGTGRMKSFWGFLGKTHLNVHFLCGELDTRYVEIGKRLKNLNPSIDLHIVANSGHMIHFEERKKFAGIVNEILKRY